MHAQRRARQGCAKESRNVPSLARRAAGSRRLTAGVLVGGELLALCLDRAQPRIEHGRVDEVDRTAGAREALTGAQPIDSAEQVAEGVARFGLGADRSERLAELRPGLRERGPGERIVRMD